MRPLKPGELPREDHDEVPKRPPAEGRLSAGEYGDLWQDVPWLSKTLMPKASIEAISKPPSK
jgi:hypothetical protein